MIFPPKTASASIPTRGAKHRLFVPDEREIRRQRRRQWQIEQQEFIDEILVTAEHIAAVLEPSRGPSAGTRADWKLLHAVERGEGRLAIADLARTLGVSRQRAQRLVRAADRAGKIELLANPHDRRILQAQVTPRGRAALADARSFEQSRWTLALHGLDDREMRTITRVLRDLRHRLQSLERGRGD